MNRGRAIIAGIAISASLLIPAAAANANTVRATSVDQWACPTGDVCLYNTYFDVANGFPGPEYYYYGTHQFSDEIGDKYLDNNQTGGAVFYLCYNYDGTDCDGPWGPTNNGQPYKIDLTPYNSIVLASS